jgi:tellurite methyltransferase
VSTTPAQEKWNLRYGDGSTPALPPTPAEWLVEHRALLDALPRGGRALDLACGDGRNARYLAELGFSVDAVDVSDLMIGRLGEAATALRLDIRPRVADLEREPALARAAYSVVMNFNYLQRSLFAALEQALRPGGLLFFETFARPHVDELGHDFPAAFVLADNELLGAFPELHVREYFEGVANRSGRPRGIASLVAERRDRPRRGTAQPGGTSGRPART